MDTPHLVSNKEHQTPRNTKEHHIPDVAAAESAFNGRKAVKINVMPNSLNRWRWFRCAQIADANRYSEHDSATGVSKLCEEVGVSMEN